MKFLPALLLFCLVFSTNAGDWPQWLGPGRDGRAASDEKFTKPEGEFRVVWKTNIGPGFSSPVVSRNRLAFLDDVEGRETLHYVEAATGRQLWTADLDETFRDEWGAGPRSTPILDGEHVYAHSCRGELRCFRVSDGKVVWSRNFDQDFGVKFLGSQAREGTAQRRGNNGSGVVAGELIIVPVGNTNGASLVALEKQSGRVVWKSGNDEAAYSSLVVGKPAGILQVIAFTADALAGFDLATGKILWRIPLKTSAKRHASTPLVIGDRIVVTSHTLGLLCYQLKPVGLDLVPSLLWENRELKINLSTPVEFQGRIFSHGPQKNFVSADLATGKTIWSAPGAGDQHSSVALVDGQVLALTDDGRLIQIKPGAEYTKLGEWQVCGKNWNFPAFAGGKIFVRDGKTIQCLESR